MRKYDSKLVDAIRQKEYTKVVDGVEILFKPVPDVDQEHVLDPRLVDLIEQKRKMFAGRAKTGWCLSNERFRPDKVTYDLTTSDVEVKEQLIPIDDDHMIDVYIYRAQEAKAGAPLLVYLHGGGYTAGDMRQFANQMKLIAELSGGVVIFPEYRLAPECPFPGPVNDAWGTVRWAYAHAAELGADPTKLMVAGDSAGGGLTAACALKDTDGIIRQIMGIYPGWDSSDYRNQTRYTWSYDAYEIAEEQKELAYSRIDRIKSGVEVDRDSSSSNLYLQGKTVPEDPLVSMIYASDEQLARFPRTIVAAAEYDYLRVGSDYAVRKLQSLGVPVRSIRYCGCDHGFLDMLGTIVQSEELCHTISEELKRL